MKTKQQIFDIVTNHLLTQKAQALGEYDTCKYRTDGKNGKVLKCAVGGLIPDDKYDDRMEGDVYNLWEGVVKGTYDNPDPEIFTSENLPFLQDLQLIHDEAGSSVVRWAEQLEAYAEKNGLEYNGVIE